MAKVVYTRFIACSESTIGTISLLRNEIEKRRRELSVVIQRARKRSAQRILRSAQRSRESNKFHMSQERARMTKRAQDILDSERARLTEHFVRIGTQTLQHALNTVIADTPMIPETFIRESLKNLLSQLTHTETLRAELSDTYRSSPPIMRIIQEANVQCAFNTETPTTRVKIKTPLGVIESDLLSTASQIIADHPISPTDFKIDRNNNEEEKLKNVA